MPYLNLKDKTSIQFNVINAQSRASALYLAEHLQLQDDSHSTFTTYSGIYKSEKIYFIEFKQQLDVYNLSTFKGASAEELKKYQSARVVINGRLPDNAILYLPPHLKCYVLQQESKNIQILDGKTKTVKEYAVVTREGYLSAPAPVEHQDLLVQQASSCSNLAAASPASVMPTPKPVTKATLSPATKKRFLDSLPPPSSGSTIDPQFANLFSTDNRKKLLAGLEEDKKYRAEFKKRNLEKAELQKIEAEEHAEKKIGLSIPFSNKPMAAAAASSSPPYLHLAPRNSIQSRHEGTKHLRQWLVHEAQAFGAWSHQTDTIAQLCDLREKSPDASFRCNAIITLPTGTGKTGTMGMIIGHSHEKVVVLVPALKLCAQSMKDIAAYSPQGTPIFDLKKEFSQKKRQDHDAVPVDKQSKQARRKQAFEAIVQKGRVFVATYSFMQRHYEYFPWDLVDGVALDEAHHLPSSKNSIMFNYLRDTQKKETIAYTATPNKSLYQLFGFKEDGSDNPLKSFKLSEAIDQQKLAPMQTGLLVLAHDAEDNVKLKMAHGEFSQKHLERKLNRDVYSHAVVDFMLNSVSPATNVPLRDMQSFVVCSGINHARRFQEILKTVITVEQLDANHELRNQYAKNIQKEQNISLEQAQAIADSTFSIGEAYYSPRQGKDDPSKKVFDDILKRFELGGIQFLMISDTLGEGYSNKKLKQCIVFRIVSSSGLLSQIGGRVLRIDQEDPQKVGHLIQVVTSDVAGNFELYAERNFSKKDGFDFKYGVFPALKPDKNFEKIDLSASSKVEYSEVWQPIETLKIKAHKRIIAKAQGHQHAEKKSSYLSKAEREQNHRIHALVRKSKKDLTDLLSRLEALFKQIKNVQVEEAEEAPNADEALPAKAAEKQRVLNEKIPKEAQLEITGFLGKSLSRLNTMERFLTPLHRLISTTASSANAASESSSKNANLSEAELINTLCIQAQKLSAMIMMLRKASYSSMDMEVGRQPDLNVLKERLEQLAQETFEAQEVLSEQLKAHPPVKKLKAVRNKKERQKLEKKECYRQRAAQYLDEIDKDRTKPIHNLLNDLLKQSIQLQDDDSDESLNKEQALIQRSSYFAGMLEIRIKEDPGLINTICKETGNTLLDSLLELIIKGRFVKKIVAEYHYSILELVMAQIDRQLLLAKHLQTGNSLFEYWYPTISNKNGLAWRFLIALDKRNINLADFDCLIGDGYLLNSSNSICQDYLFRAMRNNDWGDEGIIMEQLHRFPLTAVEHILLKLDFSKPEQKNPIHTLLSLFISQHTISKCGKSESRVIKVLNIVQLLLKHHPHLKQGVNLSPTDYQKLLSSNVFAMRLLNYPLVFPIFQEDDISIEQAIFDLHMNKVFTILGYQNSEYLLAGVPELLSHLKIETLDVNKVDLAKKKLSYCLKKACFEIEYFEKKFGGESCLYYSGLTLLNNTRKLKEIIDIIDARIHAPQDSSENSIIINKLNAFSKLLEHYKNSVPHSDLTKVITIKPTPSASANANWAGSGSNLATSIDESNMHHSVDSDVNMDDYWASEVPAASVGSSRLIGASDLDIDDWGNPPAASDVFMEDWVEESGDSEDKEMCDSDDNQDESDRDDDDVEESINSDNNDMQDDVNNSDEDSSDSEDDEQSDNEMSENIHSQPQAAAAASSSSAPQVSVSGFSFFASNQSKPAAAANSAVSSEYWQYNKTRACWEPSPLNSSNYSDI